MDTSLECRTVDDYRAAPADSGRFREEELTADGYGAYACPSVMEGDAERRYGLRTVGTIPTLKNRFYAISVEQRLRHPGAVAICEGAKSEYFNAPLRGSRGR